MIAAHDESGSLTNTIGTKLNRIKGVNMKEQQAG
jgi:hypothetical protein